MQTWVGLFPTESGLTDGDIMTHWQIISVIAAGIRWKRELYRWWITIQVSHLDEITSNSYPYKQERTCLGDAKYIQSAKSMRNCNYVLLSILNYNHRYGATVLTLGTKQCYEPSKQKMFWFKCPQMWHSRVRLLSRKLHHVTKNYQLRTGGSKSGRQCHQLW